LLPALLKSATAAACAPAACVPDHALHLSQGSEGRKGQDRQVAASCLETSVVPGALHDSMHGIQAPLELLPASTSSKPPDDPPAEASAHADTAGQEVPVSSSDSVLKACPPLCGPVSTHAAAVGDADGVQATCSASSVRADPSLQDNSSSTVAGQGPTPAAADISSRQVAETAQEKQQQHCLAALRPWLADSRLRGWEGEGSQGTQLVATVPYCRPLACLTQVTAEQQGCVGV
jgi:hypothetical protein